jgi:hypothetical protein
MLMRQAVRAAAFAAGLALILPMASEAFAGTEAGKVTRIKGEATVKRGETMVALAEGTAIEALDRIETGKEARLEVTFVDETKLTLGENAALVVDEFVYKPEVNQGFSLMNLIKGAFRFTTGKIGKLTERRVEVKTGFANLAVRGTDFWGGPIDGKSGVLVLDGVVEVTTEKGKVVLDKPNAGTSVASIGKKPGKAKAWKEDKIARAVATVSF